MGKLLSLNIIKWNPMINYNLKSLRLDANIYGPMFVSVLMSQLPEEMKLIISHELSNQEILVDKLVLLVVKQKVDFEPFNII